MRRLYTRIYVHLLGMLVLVGIVTGLVFTTNFRTAYVRGLTERLVRHGAGLVADDFFQLKQRARTVRRLSSEMEVDITVRDEEGRALEVTGPELPPLDRDDARQVMGGAATVERFRHGWYAVAPIVDGQGRVLGTIQASPVRHMRQPSLWRPAATVLLVLLIVAASAAPLARRISRPIERLTEATMRFGEGDLSSRVRVEPGHERDELARLTTAWNDMAERVQRLVRGQKELLTNVSHELRSPLARIRVALALLPRDGEDEQRLRDVEEDIGELDRLIEDVLTASRLEAGGLPAHFQLIEIQPLLAQLVERAAHDPLLDGKTVRLADPGAQSILQTIEAVADPALLKRALWNLIENAGKYGASPITVAAAVRENRLELSVSDEGPGIPEIDRRRVLQPFVRADRARTPHAKGSPPRGFGLGLTITHHIAELHQGSLEIAPAHVHGDVESGCRITLAMPLRTTV